MRPALTQAWRQAPTLHGQAAGAAMMIMPAVAHALPLDGGARGAVQVVAVLAGSAGALIVFGGLLTRAVLADRPGTVDDALLGLPHARASWAALVLLAVALAAGALWCLARLVNDGHGTDRLPEFLLLGLPAVALGWAAWRGRVMWSGAAGIDRADQPAQPI